MLTDATTTIGLQRSIIMVPSDCCTYAEGTKEPLGQGLDAILYAGPLCAVLAALLLCGEWCTVESH